MKITLDSFKKLTIELTTSCNLKCAGCPRTVAVNQGNWVNKSIDIKDFQQIINHLPKVQMVTLHGIGEPTLHKDFFKILEIAKHSSKFGLMKITTNGLARPAKYYLEAKDAGLDEIWISVDSLNQTLSSKLRENTNIKKIEENISYLSKNNFKPAISMTVSAINFRECLFSAHTLLELGAKTVHMQEYHDFGETEGVMNTEERMEFVERCQEYTKRYPGHAIKFPPFVNMTLKAKIADPNAICSAPWERPAITVDGFLTPCCTTFDPDIWGRQSLINNDWKQAYSSTIIREWINKYVQNRGNEICVGCAINPQNQNPLNDLGVRPHQAPARLKLLKAAVN